TNKIIEYFGPGVESISLTGRGTITNMGAELGATTSIFPFDSRTADYLKATFRADIAEEALKFGAALNADGGVHEHAEKVYDEVIEMDLDQLEPMLVGPHTPDKAHAASSLHPTRHNDGSAWVKGKVTTPTGTVEEEYPDEVKVGLIGSCTNSSYEDIGRAA